MSFANILMQKMQLPFSFFSFRKSICQNILLISKSYKVAYECSEKLKIYIVRIIYKYTLK